MARFTLGGLLLVLGDVGTLHAQQKKMPPIPRVASASPVEQGEAEEGAEARPKTRQNKTSPEGLFKLHRSVSPDFDLDKLLVYTALECASEESSSMLLEELEIRLPESVQIELRGESGVEMNPLTARALDWSWRPESGCKLYFRDAQGVIELSLAPDPEPEALQQAIVRVAWFISMNNAPPERAVAAKEEPVVAPATTSAVTHGMPSISPSHRDVETAAFVPAPVTNASAAPSAGLSSNQERAPAALAANEDADVENLSRTLSSWRMNTPNLFRRFGNLGEEPLTMRFLGEEAIVGSNVSVGSRLLDVRGSSSWLISGRLGLTLDERVGLGVSYERLTTTVLQDPNWDRVANPPPDAFSGLGQIRLNLLGLDAEAVMWRGGEWTLRANAGLQLGRIKSRSLADSDDQVTSFVMISELGTQLSLALLPWMDAGVGVGLRLPLLHANDWVATPEQLRGGFLSLNLRLKLF